MSTEAIAAAMVGMKQGQTRLAIGAALVRQQNEAEQAVVDLLATALQSAPAPGTGLTVDKRA